MDVSLPSPHDVLDFWFAQTPPARWWGRDDAFDASIRRRFGAVHAAAARCELYRWRVTAAGCLAEIVVLDQFSRNLYRDDARAYAQDPLALALAQTAVAQHRDEELDVDRRAFLYMPYMHSESALIHDQAAVLFAAPGLERSLASEARHRALIDRFARYPHRNAALGRVSTPEEVAFLSAGGPGF